MNHADGEIMITQVVITIIMMIIIVIKIISSPDYLLTLVPTLHPGEPDPSRLLVGVPENSS